MRHPRDTIRARRDGEALAHSMSRDALRALDDGGATCLIAWTEWDEEQDRDITYCAHIGYCIGTSRYNEKVTPEEMEEYLEDMWAEISRIEEETEEEKAPNPYYQRRAEAKRIMDGMTDEEKGLFVSVPVSSWNFGKLTAIKKKYGVSWGEMKAYARGLI